jgi:hypothetical protein
MNLDVHVRASCSARHCDFDLRAIGSAQLVQSGCRPVGQDGARPKREHRGHPMAFTAEEGLRDDRVDAVVDAVKAVGGGPPAHPSGRDPEIDKLLKPHDRVLATSQLDDLRVQQRLVV